MTKRQLLINAMIAVALSALHRIVEESAILVMRFLAGRLADRSVVVEPYLYRSTDFRPYTRPPAPQQRPANSQVQVYRQPASQQRPNEQERRKHNPYEGLYDADIFQ